MRAVRGGAISEKSLRADEEGEAKVGVKKEASRTNRADLASTPGSSEIGS